MPTNTGAGGNREESRSTLGTFWILYGIIRLVAAFLLVIYSGTATVMFGALLSRVANPFTLMDIFHVIYVVTIVIAVVGGLFGIFGGLALLGGKAAGRNLSLVAAFLSLCDIPLGTTLGIYTLVIFLP
ncbi:MAG: hypothetical protein WB780_12260 [Candidatus Acidiferrales bacterium]